VFHLAFSPDSKTLLALAPHNGGEPASTIHLWDVATGKDRPISGQGAFLYSAAFTPDGKTLATGSEQGIVLWDAVTAKERGRPRGTARRPPRGALPGGGHAPAPGGQRPDPPRGRPRGQGAPAPRRGAPGKRRSPGVPARWQDARLRRSGPHAPPLGSRHRPPA